MYAHMHEYDLNYLILFCKVQYVPAVAHASLPGYLFVWCLTWLYLRGTLRDVLPCVTITL